MDPSANGLVLYDFTAPDIRADEWRAVGDPVMGGVSESRFRTAGGHATFEGSVSLARGGGFASVRCDVAPLDLSGFAGLAIVVRGDGRRYKLQVRDREGFDTVVHRVGFETDPAAWATLRFGFERFEAAFRGRPVSGRALDRTTIAGFGFLISDRQAGPFRLDVASIAAFRCGD